MGIVHSSSACYKDSSRVTSLPLIRPLPNCCVSTLKEVSHGGLTNPTVVPLISSRRSASGPAQNPMFCRPKCQPTSTHTPPAQLSHLRVHGASYWIPTETVSRTTSALLRANPLLDDVIRARGQHFSLQNQIAVRTLSVRNSVNFSMSGCLPHDRHVLLPPSALETTCPQLSVCLHAIDALLVCSRASFLHILQSLTNPPRQAVHLDGKKGPIR